MSDLRDVSTKIEFSGCCIALAIVFLACAILVVG